MIWLLEQGYEVVGIEVSEIAVAEFFDENGFEPTIDQSETCVRWTSGRITLLQGDLLELNPSELPTVNFIYDRASLIALPLGMRLRYVRQLERLSRGPVPGLLVSMEHDRGTGPPFSIGVKELTLLYGESSTVTKIGERKGGDGSTRVVSYRIDPYPEEK